MLCNFSNIMQHKLKREVNKITKRVMLNIKKRKDYIYSIYMQMFQKLVNRHDKRNSLETYFKSPTPEEKQRKPKEK